MTRRPPFSRLPFVAIACALTLTAVSVTAKDLGTRGAVWGIAEPDLLAEIETRLEEMEASGELARMSARGSRSGPVSASRRPDASSRRPRACARPPHPSVRSFRHA